MTTTKKAIRISLHRTFKEDRAPTGTDANEGDDWSEYLATRSPLKEWADVLENRVSVVLGEAGMGKTWEFQDEAKRAANQDNVAFFLALNEVKSTEAFHIALHSQFEDFKKWKEGEAQAHFFLDAVDEARLESATYLQSALGIIVSSLNGCLQRASFVLSSRISDWWLAPVQDIVQTRLLDPVMSAKAPRRGEPEEQSSEMLSLSKPSTVEQLPDEQPATLTTPNSAILVITFFNVSGFGKLYVQLPQLDYKLQRPIYSRQRSPQ